MNTGGSAFSKAMGNHWDIPQSGMTLRDYFAAKAMQGLLFQENYEANCLSGMAYHIADAMLKSREA